MSVQLEVYTYEQFCEITKQVLSRIKVEEAVANVVANAVWNNSQDIMDCVRIGTIVKPIEDLEFIIDSFLKFTNCS
jgi:hypothetical protein